MGAPVRISDNLELSFSLILENDEIKDSSVSFSGVFQLMYTSGGRNTNITLRPNTFHYPGEMSYNTDMLTYTHSMSVEKVYDKISNLPLYIEKYVSQVAIVEAVNKAKKDEFSKYKEEVLRRLAAIESNSIFDLFEALRSVEELFGEDIVSREYWRKKLFNLLFSRGKDSE